MLKIEDKSGIDKVLKIISFKNFIKELDEDKKDLLAEFVTLVTVSSKELKHFHKTEEFNSLSEEVREDSKNLYRMIRKTEEKWNRLEWSRCRRFVGIIERQIVSNKKDQKILTSYGYKN